MATASSSDFFDETREFERLDDLMSNVSFLPTDDSRSLNERRWLALYDKR